MSAIFIGLCAMLLIRSLILHRHFSANELLRSQRRGLSSCELRRSAHLASHRDVYGARTLPAPLETRTLVWRCAGLAWRTQSQSIGLPNMVATCVTSVPVEQFDALFSPDFRLCAPTPATAGLGSALVR